ncbi:SH3 and multiple ankyrin repeat domains protein 2 [Takifugu flavidus]|uniref:SH3 and multiple ankyrin repeat domains protein 2 n=1 Tax=Takifugu flavidus TaxID=433684 RepID=A0A5C6P9G4_9TELE|nr:SH3 and multiple ankyrin repeat domains protein 2 [Takifugu flavidus]
MSVTTGSGFQFPGITTVTYVFVYSPGSMQRDPSPPHHTPPALAGSRGPKRKLYSAVPGRTFIVVKPYTPQGEGEIQLNRGERVKGKFSVFFLGQGGGERSCTPAEITPVSSRSTGAQEVQIKD